MMRFARSYIFWSGAVAAIGSALHIAIIFGGPDWYAFFGAPAPLVEMARNGNPRAPMSCFVIASILAIFAVYAFSAAGTIRRLPFLRVALSLISSALILRGLLFVPLLLWDANSLARICNCHGIDTFIIVTSLLCLALGIGFAFGVHVAGSESIEPTSLRDAV